MEEEFKSNYEKSDIYSLGLTILQYQLGIKKLDEIPSFTNPEEGEKIKQDYLR
jgi:hypothetical protein